MIRATRFAGLSTQPGGTHGNHLQPVYLYKKVVNGAQCCNFPYIGLPVQIADVGEAL